MTHVLSPVRLPVRFDAPARSGPVTLGQRNVLRWISREGDHRSTALPAFAEVPAGTTVPDIAEAIRLLVIRHESLRTTFSIAGEFRQHVQASGELGLEVHEVTGDGHRFVGELLERALAESFEIGAGLPVRALVVTAGSVPFLVIFVFSHLAVDVAGAQVVARQFGELLAGGRVPGAHQPLDQAAWERSQAGQRRMRAALRYWETELRRMPQAMFALPPHPEGTPGHHEVRLRSAAVAQALRALVARHRVSHSAMIFAAGAALLAGYTGIPAGAVVSICGNRFRPSWRSYVGTIAQDALVPVRLDPDGSFDDAVRQVQEATMNACRYAFFDSAELWAIIDEVCHTRGIRFHRDCVFNDTGVHTDIRQFGPTAADPAALAEAMRSTRVEPMASRSLPAAFFLTLAGIADHEVDIQLYADTEYLPAKEIERFLLGVERLLVTAATEPVRFAELPVLTGIQPVVRGQNWRFIDSCWVDLDAVRELLEALPDVRTARVFVDEDRLTAFVAGDDLTPGQLHAGCLAGLEEHLNVMCPQWYVVSGPAGMYEGSGRD